MIFVDFLTKSRFFKLFSRREKAAAVRILSPRCGESARSLTARRRDAFRRPWRRTVTARVRRSAELHRDMYVTFDRAKVTKARSGAGKEDSPAPDTSTLFAVRHGQPPIQPRVGAFTESRTPAIARSADARRTAHITAYAPGQRVEYATGSPCRAGACSRRIP